MKIGGAFLGLAALLLAAALTPGPALGQVLDRLQATGIKGRFLHPGGQPVEEYDYLEPGKEYRLLPGASVELSSLDGEKSYSVTGPGLLSFETSGLVTLNGKPLAASTLQSALKNVTAAGIEGEGLGGIRLRARDEGVKVRTRTADGGTSLVRLYSGYHALVVGAGAYRQGWPRLPSPVKEAEEVAALLKDMGWEVDLVEDPEGASLRKAFNSLITGPGRDKERAILVWFSGHGHTLAEADGSRLGYLVPVDAPDPDLDEMGFMERALSMRQVETVARRIQAKHVLMIFDSCFSGAIFQITRAKPSPFIEEKVTRPVRQFLTAGDENEKVPDKSVFKTVFIQGLRDGEADRNRDGYVTGQELGAYLEERVVNYSQQAQHPQYGKIANPKLDKGDFVFVLQPSGGAKPPEEEDKTLASASATARSGPQVVAERPLVGRVSVTSDLDGVEFKLADRWFQAKSGSALIVAGVPAGEQEVVARKEGYPQWQGRVQVRPDQTANLAIEMAAGAQSSRTSAGNEIRVMLRAWQEAWNRLDEAAILACYADEATIMTKTKAGLASVPKERYAEMLHVRIQYLKDKGFERKMEAPHALEIEGDRARVAVRSEVIVPGEDGPTRIIDQLRLVKRGGRWLIIEYRFMKI